MGSSIDHWMDSIPFILLFCAFPIERAGEIEEKLGGFNVETIEYKNISFTVWDVGGQEKDLFSVVGDVKTISVHYDKSGRSKGTAEVVYSQWKDAVAAVKRYNNIQLDGKPMEVKIVGMVTATSAVMSPYGSYGLREEGRGSGLTRLIQGGNMHTRGRGPGRRHGEKANENISAEELDADLDKYHAEAMQTR